MLNMLAPKKQVLHVLSISLHLSHSVPVFTFTESLADNISYAVVEDIEDVNDIALGQFIFAGSFKTNMVYQRRLFNNPA